MQKEVRHPVNYDYIITENGELYHWKKKDAKYIDRKWSKGKWVYTYPSDTKGRSGKAANEFDRKTAVDSRKKAVGIVGKKPDSANTSKKTSANVSKEYLAELEYNSKKNEYPKQTTSTNTSTKKAETPKKKSGDGFKKLVDKAKDWLGFDEKEKYESAKEQEKIAKSQEAVAKKKDENTFEKSKEQNVKSSKAWGKADGASKKSGDKLDIDTIRTAAKEESKAKVLWDAALNDSDKSTAAEKKREIAEGNTKLAYEDYLNTPVGFLSNPSDATKQYIRNGKENLQDWFDNLERKRRK